MSTSRKIRIFVLSVFFFLTGISKAAVIYSTLTGGNWNASTTWVGGIIPLVGDDVVIQEGAIVNTILGAYNTCNHLTVQSGATLQHNGTGLVTLTVYGSLVNNGTISNDPGFLELIVYGNITFTGEEFSIFRLRLAGTSVNTITFGNGLAFTGGSVFVNNAPHPVSAGSDLTFINTALDFNGSTLTMCEGCRLSLSGQSLIDITLSGANNKLEMTNGAYLQNSDLYGTTLYGTVLVGGGILNFNDSLVISAGATLDNFGSSHTVYINGAVINYGTITNSSNPLNIHITGNIYNHGAWENYETILSGYNDQYLTFGEGIVFSGTNFYNDHPDEKTIFALTDISFAGTNVNFAWGAGGGIRGTLVMNNNACLRFSGSGLAKVLGRLNLASQGNTARLHMSSGAYLQSFSNTCSNLILEGNVQAGNSEIYFSNNVYVNDTLINYGGTMHTVYVNGNLVNMGYIMNGVAYLELRVSGNITYRGMEWSNYKVKLNGTATRCIEFAPYSVFSGEFFECEDPHNIEILSSLSFQGTRINFDYSNITFANGAGFNLEGYPAYIINAYVFGNISCNFNGGAYPGNIVFNGTNHLTGQCPVYNNNVHFNSEVVNNSAFRNQNATAHTVYLNSHFSNSDTVDNGVGMGNFILELKGNVFNDGIWNNYENKINGTADQHIRLIDDKPVHSRTVLQSNLGGSGFQWYKNNVAIPGETGVNLVLNQVSIAEYGLYYCTSTMGQSRTITICGYMGIDFEGTPLSGCQPTEVSFTGNAVSTYPIQSWYWEFGDDSTATTQHTLHRYANEGNYNVRLTINDGYVSRTLQKDQYIPVSRTPFPDFAYTTVILGNQAHFYDSTINYLVDEVFDTLYVSEVIDFSSQWSTGSWSAQKLLGPPDVYPHHRDDTSAWASSTANSQREYLELHFSQLRQISAVIVYENLYPGTIDTVYVKNPATGLWETVWYGTASPQPLAARAFTAGFPLTDFSANEVRIALNSPALPYWNEIYSVAVVSPVSSVISSQTTYL